MIEKMTRYDFILLSGYKDDFLEELRKLGVMDITRSSKPFDQQSRELFRQFEDVQAEIRRISSGRDDVLASLKEKGAQLVKEQDAARHWGSFDKGKIASLGIPVRFYTAEELKALPGDFPPSEFVAKVTVVDNVCERAALMGAEKLILHKTAVNGVTVALAAEKTEVRFG